MRTTKAFLVRAAFVFVVACLALTVVWAISEPTITTDKNRYGVGETMMISGRGFSPNAVIQLGVLRPDHSTEYVVGVSSDVLGSFVASYTPALPLDPGRYKITATDGTSTAVTASTEADAAAASLDQCRNGTAASPNDCTAVSGGTGWVNGNVGAQQGHFIEGYSIPYRMTFTGLSTGTWTVDIGYDIKHQGGHAIDFLTHYSQIDIPGHELVFSHAPECIDPTDGVFGAADGCTLFSAATTAPISKPTNLPDSTPVIDLGPPCTFGFVMPGATSCPGTSLTCWLRQERSSSVSGEEPLPMWITSPMGIPPPPNLRRASE